MTAHRLRVKCRRELLQSAILLFFFGALTVGTAALSQEVKRKTSATFSVNVEVVNVLVTVHDKRGNIIKDLTQEDFTLSEDGRKQPILYFSRETDLPLTIGLIVDTTPSENDMLEEEKAASQVFLNKMLRPGKDSAFLVQFGDQEMELLQDLTSDPKLIEAGLSRLERHSMGMGSGFPGMAGRKTRADPVLRRRSGARFDLQTILADSLYMVSHEIMEPLEGRKALIVIGDGYHIGDRMDWAISAARQANTLIYAVRVYDPDFAGDGGGGFGPFGGRGGGLDPDDWKKDLKSLSKETGGSYFEVGKKQTLEDIYARIEEELRSQYSLGYTPDAKAKSGFRKIKVNVERDGMVVNGREGYYPRLK